VEFPDEEISLGLETDAKVVGDMESGTDSATGTDPDSLPDTSADTGTGSNIEVDTSTDSSVESDTDSDTAVVVDTDTGCSGGTDPVDLVNESFDDGLIPDLWTVNDYVSDGYTWQGCSDTCYGWSNATLSSDAGGHIGCFDGFVGSLYSEELLLSSIDAFDYGR